MQFSYIVIIVLVSCLLVNNTWGFFQVILKDLFPKYGEIIKNETSIADSERLLFCGADLKVELCAKIKTFKVNIDNLTSESFCRQKVTQLIKKD